MSVGGGGAGSHTFAEVARSRSSRERFAQTAKAFVEQYNLDGIDSELSSYSKVCRKAK